MRISDYQIHCEMCHLLSSEDEGRGFTIQVPIDTGAIDEHLTATILCQITEQSHHLTLQCLNNSKGQYVTLAGREKEKLRSVLEKVEQSRLCGNAKICPQRVVQLVSELHKRMKD